MSFAFAPIRRALMPSLMWVSTAVWAQVPAGGPLVGADEALPSRLALCQRELGAMQDPDRQRLLRACLSRRLEGERIVERNCRRQAGGVRSVSERQQTQRACERLALGVKSADLPKAPPPAPRLVLTVDTGTPVTAVGTAPAMTRKPSSGEF